jgi:hypothetical protein
LPASPFKTDGWGREKSGNNLPIRVFMMSYKGQRRMTMHMKSSEERKKTAIEVIREGAGNQFDPQIAESFIRIIVDGSI